MNARAGQLVVDAEHLYDRATLVSISSPPDPHWAPVVIRLATQADRHALEALAQLDCAKSPVGQVLIGEVLGRAVAAVSLVDGQAIADPFVAAADITDLIRLRAAQLASGPGAGRRRRYRRPR